MNKQFRYLIVLILLIFTFASCIHKFSGFDYGILYDVKSNAISKDSIDFFIYVDLMQCKPNCNLCIYLRDDDCLDIKIHKLLPIFNQIDTLKTITNQNEIYSNNTTYNFNISSNINLEKVNKFKLLMDVEFIYKDHTKRYVDSSIIYEDWRNERSKFDDFREKSAPRLGH